jgi:predicted transcriptional regulator
MVEFTLPVLSQDQFSTFYGKQVPRDDSVVETIVYPGKKLTCSVRSRSIKKNVKPENVFITCIEDGTEIKYIHRIFGDDNTWSVLPKRLHTVCFPKIQLGSIPITNRIRLQLTDTIFQDLPVIPDEFYKQKLLKAEKPNKPITRRNKRKRTDNVAANSNVVSYIGWRVHGVDAQPKKSITKDSIIGSLRDTLDKISKKNLVVKNPFDNVESVTSTEETIKTFTTIAQFIHHYGREEFRMQVVEPVSCIEEVWDSVKDSLN